MSKHNTNTNPKLRQFTFGISSLKTVTMYPLSMPDYDAMFEALFLSAHNALGGNWDGLEEISWDKALILFKNVVGQNISEICKKVFRKQDVGKDPASEMDADQFIVFVDNLYYQNFETSVKNGQSLFTKIKNSLIEKGLLISSSQTIPDTD